MWEIINRNGYQVHPVAGYALAMGGESESASEWASRGGDLRFVVTYALPVGGRMLYDREEDARLAIENILPDANAPWMTEGTFEVRPFISDKE